MTRQGCEETLQLISDSDHVYTDVKHDMNTAAI